MQSFYSRFLTSATSYPSQIAAELQLAHPSTQVVSHTYAELRRMAESVGQWLRDHHVPPGARCAILAANGPRWVTAYLGAISMGAVAVPLDTAFKPDQVAKLLVDSGSSLIFTDAKHLDIVCEAIDQIPHVGVPRPSNGNTANVGVPRPSSARAGVPLPRIVLLEPSPTHPSLPTFDSMFAQKVDSFEPHPSAPDDLAVLLYTSGTTSDPKGVMLTHANLDAEANAVFDRLRIDSTDSILGVLPLFHALAQMANLLLPYSVGARVVYLEQLNTTELLRGLRDRNITLFCCVPQFFYLIHERVMKQVAQLSWVQRTVFAWLKKLSVAARQINLNLGKIFFSKVHQALGQHMRYLITGGSRFDPQIGRDLEALGFDILQAYGLTETSGGATVGIPARLFNGSVGQALPGVDVRILTAPTSGSPAGTNGASSHPRAGEIAIRGPIVMKGYYNRPDATAEVIKDGWLHTGDLGYLDASGNLFITGREKDVIVLSSGKNIHPEEIEAHYLASPWIKEICVLGLESAPGQPFSERLHAIIVPDFELMRQKKIVNMREVIRFDVETLSAQIASTKRILSYDIWQQDLPRTTTRKLKRHEIRRMMQSLQTSVALGPTDSEAGASPAPARAAQQEPLTDVEMAYLARPEVERAMKVISGAAKSKAASLAKSGSARQAAVSLKDNLELDLGLDSMERVELVVALEQALNSRADEAAISQVYTVRELIDTVIAGMGSASADSRSGTAGGWSDILAVDPTDPEVLAVVEDRPIATLLWFAFGCIVGPLTRLFFRMKITGLEKLPRSGPFILSPNHQSFLDGPIVTAQLPFHVFKDLFYVGTSEIFSGGVMRRLARSLKLIPVDPDANLVPAMRAGAFGLKRGKILVLYPEGERSIDGAPKTFKKGAAILAIHQKVPIVPVALEGFHDVWPRGYGFQGFHRLQMSVGDPIYPPQLAANAPPEAAYEQLNSELRNRLLELWQPLHARNSNGRATALARN